jgi:hypothetical protein
MNKNQDGFKKWILSLTQEEQHVVAFVLAIVEINMFIDLTNIVEQMREMYT